MRGTNGVDTNSVKLRRKSLKMVLQVATKEKHNKGIKKLQKARTVKYTYIVLTRENCCEEDCG